jgi:hypothetical protein
MKGPTSINQSGPDPVSGVVDNGVDVEEAIERKWLVWRPDRATAVSQPSGEAADGGGDPSDANPMLERDV